MSETDRAGQKLGPYVIDSLVGRGGMGEVYRATDSLKGRVVALKLLNPDVADDAAFRERFMRESRVAAQLNDPHVIPIHDFGEIDGRLYLDMRLVEGRDMRALLQAEGALPPQRALKIVGQIADALDAAHAHGLSHRDVKPDNILIDHRDFAYLVDFGLAAADTDTRLTSTGTAIGSFGYMAPERFGDAPVGAAADIYALACVLFESLTGTHPFASATTIQRLIAAHLTAPPPRVGAAIDEVIARGMAKNPDDRPSSAAALVSEADAALAADPLGAPRTVVPGEPPTVVGAPHQTPHTFVPQAFSPQPHPTAHGAPPGQWAPTQQATWPTPPARRSPVLPIAIATLVVLLVCAGVLGWALLTSDEDEPPVSAAESSATVETPATSTPEDTAPAAPPADGPEPTTTEPPAPAPAITPPPASPPGVGRAMGDLGLSVPITRPACDGTGIVVVGNAIAPGAYASEVQALLDRYPGASYLRSDQSCPSLRQNVDGNAIYAVYFVAGSTLGDICAMRNRLGGDAYGKWLDTTSDPTTFITC